MNPTRYVFKLRIEDDFGKKIGEVWYNTEEEMTVPHVGFVDFNSLLDVLKRREERNKRIRAICVNMAAKIIDDLMDLEGWNGPERQEAAEKRRR